MNFAEEEPSKKYCIKGKHVAIICGVVVAVGLIVGLSVGLTRSCEQDTTPAPSQPPPEASTALPPQDQNVCPDSEDESGEWKNFRLPDFINPVHYDLEVKALMEEDRYTGIVTISVNLSKPTRDLWLHIRETKITKLPELRRPSGEQVPIRRCFEYKKQEYVVIQAAEDLAATSGDSVYRLTMEFKGWLNGSLVGFYKTTYMEDGQIRYVLCGAVCVTVCSAELCYAVCGGTRCDTVWCCAVLCCVVLCCVVLFCSVCGAVRC
jgi:glutamyl aminopeptidase